jgi:hypothetical protein
MGAADELQQFGVYGSYDLAVNKWMRKVMTAVEPTTVVIQASPQRAFGEAAAMVAKGLIDPARTLPPAKENNNLNREALVPLPLVSIQPGAPEPRETQRLTPCKNLFRTSLPGTDPSQRERYVARPPLPIWLTYTCELWTKTRSTMNALITAFQQQFDPYMAWDEVVIDDWFWGTVWMPIKLAGITDNSELEAGDKDRTLRHTISLRIEAWCFFPPAKDLTVHRTTLDTLVSHLQDLYYVDPVHFPCFYLEAPSKHLYKVAATARGHLNVIAVGAPPNPVTHYFGAKILIFNRGFVLDAFSTTLAPNINNWAYDYNGDPNQAALTASRVFSTLDTSPPLFVSAGQEFLIGGDGFYVQVYLRRNLQLGFRPRYLLDANKEPLPPPLPYEVEVPG